MPEDDSTAAKRSAPTRRAGVKPTAEATEAGTETTAEATAAAATDAGGADPLHNLADAARRGAADAQAAASRVVPALKRNTAKAIYSSCYYLSYGVVYGATVVSDLIPKDNAVVHGLCDGAQAARAAVAARKARQAAASEEAAAGAAILVPTPAV